MRCSLSKGEPPRPTRMEAFADLSEWNKVTQSGAVKVLDLAESRKGPRGVEEARGKKIASCQRRLHEDTNLENSPGSRP